MRVMKNPGNNEGGPVKGHPARELPAGSCPYGGAGTGERYEPITTWPLADRPRERLLAQGAGLLSDTELLAILLTHGRRGKSAVGLARELLQRHGDIMNLGRLSGSRLMALAGVGPAKAARILAACELGRRRERKHHRLLTRLDSPAAAASIAAAKLRDRDRECVLALYLDVKNRLLREELLSLGSLSQAVIHPREIFKLALELSASGLIIAHNHPSGDTTPSAHDLQLTAQLQAGAALLGLRLLDHLIIGDGDYRSLLAEGYLGKFGGEVVEKKQ